MCAGGRVVNYLKAMLGDARNDVLFVGYQAAGTPGRDILKYGTKPVCACRIRLAGWSLMINVTPFAHVFIR